MAYKRNPFMRFKEEKPKIENPATTHTDKINTMGDNLPADVPLDVIIGQCSKE